MGFTVSAFTMLGMLLEKTVATVIIVIVIGFLKKGSFVACCFRGTHGLGKHCCTPSLTSNLKPKPHTPSPVLLALETDIMCDHLGKKLKAQQHVA